MQEVFSQFHDFIAQPWPWYVAGPLLAIMMVVLLFLGHEFGISENFRIMCAAEGADSLNEFFKFDWKSGGWNLMVAFGAVLGGYFAAQFFFPSGGEFAHVSNATMNSLHEQGILRPDQQSAVLIPEFISWRALMSWKGWLIIAGGGFLVGFGARYAGGCTSGHAISGLSALQLPSLIAVIGFFLGGLFMTYVLIPFIFPW